MQGDVSVRADRCSVAVGRDLVLGEGATLHVGCRRSSDAQCAVVQRRVESMLLHRVAWCAIGFTAAFAAGMFIGRVLDIDTASLVEPSIYAGTAGYFLLPWCICKLRTWRITQQRNRAMRPT